MVLASCKGIGFKISMRGHLCNVTSVSILDCVSRPIVVARESVVGRRPSVKEQSFFETFKPINAKVVKR